MSEKSPQFMDAKQPEKHNLDFADVLAAAVHDMKNSLGLVIQSIETLSQYVPAELSDAHEHISRTQYEAVRLNSNLVQLLSLYKSDIEQLPTHIDEYNVADIFEELVSSNTYYAQQHGIAVTAQVDSNLYWCFDAELVYLLLNDALINSLRYGNKNVLLSASIVANEHANYLSIVIEDDGDGYPASMLQQEYNVPHTSNVKNGRTGLGLFFASLIAHAHENKGQRGEISLANGGNLEGSVFSVNLP